MTDAERLRRAIEEDTFVGNMTGLLRDEVIRLRKELEDRRLAANTALAFWQFGEDAGDSEEDAFRSLRRAAGLDPYPELR